MVEVNHLVSDETDNIMLKVKTIVNGTVSCHLFIRIKNSKYYGSKSYFKMFDYLVE